MLYTKGIEEELFVGTSDGTGETLSKDIQHTVHGFTRELDERFTEYATQPCLHYGCLLRQMLSARKRLRSYLSSRGHYTIIPGGTLPLEPRDRVCPADEEDAYYRYLLDKFGTHAVMAGSHLNIGIDDPELLMRACRVVRMEAAIYIALTASSPFFNGEVTGHRSTRWLLFPQEPFPVPLFDSHEHYVSWVEGCLHSNKMVNVRHLWASVRPNGERRPYDVNRLELRVCDSNPDPRVTLAALALLESRVAYLASRPRVDVQNVSVDQLAPEEIRRNERAACHEGLDATVFRWDTGRPSKVRDWIADLYEQALEEIPTLEQKDALKPIEWILEKGNTADLWRRNFSRGLRLREVVSNNILEMEGIEAVVRDELDLDDMTLPCAHAEEPHLVLS